MSPAGLCALAFTELGPCLAYLREEGTRFVNLEKLLKKEVEDLGEKYRSSEVMN